MEKQTFAKGLVFQNSQDGHFDPFQMNKCNTAVTWLSLQVSVF